jgi:hypothetical protein
MNINNNLCAIRHSFPHVQNLPQSGKTGTRVPVEKRKLKEFKVQVNARVAIRFFKDWQESG